jgi:hypothetical protein
VKREERHMRDQIWAESHGFIGGIQIPESFDPVITDGRTLYEDVDAPELGFYHRVVLLLDVPLVEDFEGARARLETSLAGANNDLIYVAREAGTDGNGITVEYTDPAGNNQPLTVSVVGEAIDVSLATGPGGEITSTAQLILLAVLGNAGARALVSVEHPVGSDGSGVVTAMDETALAGGTEPSDGELRFTVVQYEPGGAEVVWESDLLTEGGYGAAIPLAVSGHDIELRAAVQGMVIARAYLIGYNPRFAPPVGHRWNS